MKVCMVSTYPPLRGGVSSYTQNLVSSLRKAGVNVTVLSGELPKMKTKTDCEANVLRCWKRGALYPFQIFKNVIHVDAELIHVQHEFFLYGGMFSAILFPVLLILLKLLRKNLVVTLHGVIPVSAVNKQFLVENGMAGPAILVKFGSIFLSRIITSISNVVVVHEKFLAKVLKKDYGCPGEKIKVIPIGVKELKSEITSPVAKEKIGLRDKTVILFFGYITPYKGVDRLIEGFGRLAKEHQDWILVISGGEHPRLHTMPSYGKYVFGLRQRAQEIAPNQIIFMDHITDRDIEFFPAADVMVFPYKTGISSSATFTIALAYKKPIVVSDVEIFGEKVPCKDVVFERDSSEDLARKLELLLSDDNLKVKLTDFVANLCSQSTWMNVGAETARMYKEVIAMKQTSPTYVSLLKSV